MYSNKRFTESVLTMKAQLEKLVPESGDSFRCFDRSTLKTTVKWHRHPEIEINYVESGQGTRIVGDNIDTYGSGDLVLLGSNLPHTWMSDDYIGKKFDRHPSIVIQFLPEMLGEPFLSLPETDGIRRLLVRSKRGIKFNASTTAKLGQLINAMLTQKGAERLISMLHCLHLMACSRNNQPLASRGYHGIENDLSDSRIQAVCQYVNSNLTDPNLSPEAILDLVKMNPSAFSRFFKKTTGRTLTRYVAELRIALACRKLAASDEKILNICYSVGFQNLSNFNRRFKEIKNATPREFRKRVLAGKSG